MELKRRKMKCKKCGKELLIVPYGIETRDHILLHQQVHRLLIVPYVIETTNAFKNDISPAGF